MHPNPRFRWDDEAGMRAFVAEIAFAQICAVAGGAPLLAHAPLSFGADGTPQFHLARANPLSPVLDGAAVALGIVADSFYVSPDWYAVHANQVPTWNYRVVEIHGRARRLDDAGLQSQLDRLAADREARLAPKPPWTNAKVDPGALAAMRHALAGFAVEEPRFVGTAKLSQNRSEADRAGVRRALEELGAGDAARALADAR